MDLNIFTAFVAGIISFISPCVFPLIPAYISYVSGASIAELQSKGSSGKVLLGLVFFVAGFSLVFILFGATATFIGSLLAKNKYVLAKFAGTIIVLFGLSFVGVFSLRRYREYPKQVRLISWLFLLASSILLYRFILPEGLYDSLLYLASVSILAFVLNYFGLISFEFLNYEKKLNIGRISSTYLNSFVLGISFAFGWTPCIGPILSAILGLASVQETVWQGIVLLSFYSMGLGIPFIISGILVERLIRSIGKLKRFFRAIEVVSGILLILIGVMIFTDLLSQLAYLFPQIELPY